MIPKYLKSFLFAITMLLFIVLSGCATLEVTKPQQINANVVRLPVTVAIRANGEKLRDSFNTEDESAIKSASGKLFEKIILLPDEARFKTATEIRATYKADYILSVQLSDVNVHGNLNPIWFASIPLFFLKPFAPIVTFESSVTLDSTVLNVQTGLLEKQKEISKSSTDHFSPVKPQEKVQKLISRNINNAMVSVLEELHKTVATVKSNK